MGNPLKILKEIQVKLQSTLNIETTNVYSKKHLSTDSNKPIAVAEVKNINQSKITVSGLHSAEWMTASPNVI